MSAEPLAVYLDDHLAGSVAALKMMEELIQLESGRALEAKLRELHAEVLDEQRGVRDLLERIRSSPSPVKQAAAWLSEKVGEGRLALSARTHPALARMQALEALALGLQGKLALYRVLAELAPDDRRLHGDFAALADRTTRQHAMVEHERLAAARAAFARTGEQSG